MKIIRVFIERTSYTPDDDMVFIGFPPFAELIPEHDEVHISVIFTWDKEQAELLRFAWQYMTDKPVLVGGPAYGSLAHDFTPNLYVKRGITFTSRGCNNNCSWCLVPKVEGKLKELPIIPGNIIQDNNFLQTSRAHQEAVFDMLHFQSGICFKGGLQASLLTEWHAERFSKLRIKELWLACDTDEALDGFYKAAKILNKYGLGRGGKTKDGYIKCYALIGKDGISQCNMNANQKRLQNIYTGGAMPFAQLYQPGGDKKIEYSHEWRRFARAWQRPAAIKAHMEKGTDWRDFNT